ncbi:MAG: hypothetical protein HY749_05295 [Gammaproteobacteria bacterium]|nr:hypothetical protein [Gammaproteobacteria bacterium]MBI5618308.1 hypothetical protein [Gammaproteobacteria bacterium]
MKNEAIHDRHGATRAAVLAAGLAACGTAGAAPVVWSLSSVTFTDGAAASGFFVYDADSHTVGDYSIGVTAGSGATADLTAFYYFPSPGPNSSGSAAVEIPGNAGSAMTLRFTYTVGSQSLLRDLRLSTDFALDSGGGSAVLVADGSYLSSGEHINAPRGTSRAIVGGVLTGTPVPVPASVWSLVCALVALGTRRRRMPRVAFFARHR